MVHSYQNLDSWTPSSTSKNGETSSAMMVIDPEEPSTSQDSDKTLSEIKQICFLPKLWKLPDGRLDLDSLMTCFNLILGHLTFTQTDMDEDALLEAFGSVIPPVQILELLELLATMECVRKNEVFLHQTTFDPLVSASKSSNISSFDDFFAAGDALMMDTDGAMFGGSSNASEPTTPSENPLNPFSFSNITDTQLPKKTEVYEASVDAFSRLSLIYDSLKMVFGPGSSALAQQLKTGS